MDFTYSGNEEEDMRDFTVRETERLKFVTGRSGEETQEEVKEKEKVAEVEEEGADDEEKKEALDPSLILYNKYKALEEEVLAKVGIKKGEMDRRSSKQAANLKSLLKP